MRVRRLAWSACVAALLALSASPTSAQSSLILPSTRVLLAGPVAFYPTLALRDAGTDSNVYSDSSGIKGDFTYTVVPRLYVVLPMGDTRFVATGFGNFVYYQTYKDQQSISGTFQGRYEVMGPGFRPYAIAGFADRRERRGYEIDARVRQRQTMMSVGAEMDVTAKAALLGWAGHVETAWDRNAQYFGAYLSDQLDYTSNTFTSGARFRASPLTTVSLTTEYKRDRFDRRTIRDADALLLGPSLDFETGAMVVGHIQVGYLVFKPLSPTVAGYRGVATTARLRYLFREITEVKLDADRDVDYSYNPLQPYYLESGGILTVNQHVVGPLEVIAIGERRDLHNQQIGEPSFNGRHEITRTIGGGIAFQIHKQMRFELLYERRTRTSDDPTWRDYERRRLFASIFYGL